VGGDYNTAPNQRDVCQVLSGIACRCGLLMNTPKSVFFICEIDLQLTWSWDKVLSIVFLEGILSLEGQVDQAVDT
jgi:hypothetical protein